MTLKLGRVTTIVISSSSMAKEILQKNDIHFSSRSIPEATRAHRHNEVSMVWLPDSTQWRNLRRICNSEIFTVQKLDYRKDLLHQKMQELVAHIQDCCQVGVAVDIGQLVFSTSLNLLSQTIFSIDLASPSSEMARELRETVCHIMEEVGKLNLADFFPILCKIDPQGVRQRMEIYFERFFRLSDNMISARHASREALGTSPSEDVLDVLLNISESTQEISCSVIKSLLLDLIGAGTDTTSSTIEWAMTELLRNPTTMSKAQQEIETLVGKNNPVTESDIPKLPYLQAIVKETFRLHPAAPLLLPHKAKTDVELCNFTIPENTKVLINVWAIQHEKAMYEKPECFIPERFLGLDVDFKGRHFELIPFGSGRRICPGLPLATRVIHQMLASLIHGFNWKLEDSKTVEDIDMEDRFGITLQKAQPLRAIPISR